MASIPMTSWKSSSTQALEHYLMAAAAADLLPLPCCTVWGKPFSLSKRALARALRGGSS